MNSLAKKMTRLRLRMANAISIWSAEIRIGLGIDAVGRTPRGKGIDWDHYSQIEYPERKNG